MDPSWRASGQEAVVAIAELMETFRDIEQSCPGFCDHFLLKLSSSFKTRTSYQTPPTNTTKSIVTKSSAIS